MAEKKKSSTKRVAGGVYIHRQVGLPKPQVFYGRTKAEAERKYQDAVLSYKLECMNPKEKRYTFRVVCTAYEEYILSDASPVRRGTINAYRKYFKPLRDYFGDTVMNDTDPQAVRGYLEYLKVQGKSKHTVANAKSVLSCVFSYWCANYHGNANPVLLTKLPAGLREGKRGEPTEEQRDLINAHPEGCGFWAWLFEYTGLRMGEANGLQWKDVDLDAGTITPVQAMPWDHNQPYRELLKTENAYRAIPILTPLRPLLEAGKAAHQPEDYVLSGTSKPLTQCQYSHQWMLYCRELGLCESYTRTTKMPAYQNRPERSVARVVYKPLVTAHQFRHLFATNLFYAGVPDMVAQQLLGHADIMTTRRIYQHLRDGENKQYTKLLDAYVSGKSGDCQKKYETPENCR